MVLWVQFWSNVLGPVSQTTDSLTCLGTLGVHGVFDTIQMVIPILVSDVHHAIDTLRRSNADGSI
jgi:hypothetical protein